MESLSPFWLLIGHELGLCLMPLRGVSYALDDEQGAEKRCKLSRQTFGLHEAHAHLELLLGCRGSASRLGPRRADAPTSPASTRATRAANAIKTRMLGELTAEQTRRTGESRVESRARAWAGQGLQTRLRVHCGSIADALRRLPPPASLRGFAAERLALCASQLDKRAGHRRLDAARPSHSTRSPLAVGPRAQSSQRERRCTARLLARHSWTDGARLVSTPSLAPTTDRSSAQHGGARPADESYGHPDAGADPGRPDAAWTLHGAAAASSAQP